MNLRAQLSQLVTEYTELTYPSDAERAALTEAQAEDREVRAINAACRIADMLIGSDLIAEDDDGDEP
ncbi:hypothetical protein [Dactylosporangium sp. CA-092794]|uniref:hypothetical protein n=1 Tax=Dactylosporangium sp. CA-092794 TaxID=3239929 RepID=UPI003D92B429